MGDSTWDAAGQLRTLAVDLVQQGRTADATAVLVAIGAVEMLPTFAEAGGPGGSVQPAPSPGY
jgi:hypothetical protein